MPPVGLPAPHVTVAGSVAGSRRAVDALAPGLVALEVSVVDVPVREDVPWLMSKHCWLGVDCGASA